MKFYDCTIAPSPRRVRIFLAEKGIELETEQVDLVGGQNLTADYRRNVNPRGLCPALVLDDGTSLGESFSICRYLEELHPEPCLMGANALDRAQIDSRVRQIEMEGFLPGAEAFRNTAEPFKDRGVPGAAGVPAIPALAERGLKFMPHFFDVLERWLEEGDYLYGGQYSIVDITALCVVDFFAWVKVKVPDSHSRTAAWHQRMSARPSAKA